MLSRSMSIGSIGIMASPGQDGSTVNDEITGSSQSRPQGVQNSDDKKGLMHRCSGGVATFALLGGARNARLSLLVHGEPTRKSQGRPALKPVVHILIGEPPEGT